MDGSKSIPTENRDIGISLKTLKKVNKYVERAASNHLAYYTKILCKRKIVQEEEEFNLKNTKYGNNALNKTRFNCKSFLEIEDSTNRKTTSNKNSKHLYRNV